MLTICSNFVVFLKMRPHFIEFPFYREKVASQKWLRSPFYRIPILSRAYCNELHSWCHHLGGLVAEVVPKKGYSNPPNTQCLSLKIESISSPRLLRDLRYALKWCSWAQGSSKPCSMMILSNMKKSSLLTFCMGTFFLRKEKNIWVRSWIRSLKEYFRGV